MTTYIVTDGPGVHKLQECLFGGNQIRFTMMGVQRSSSTTGRVEIQAKEICLERKSRHKGGDWYGVRIWNPANCILTRGLYDPRLREGVFVEGIEVSPTTIILPGFGKEWKPPTKVFGCFSYVKDLAVFVQISDEGDTREIHVCSSNLFFSGVAKFTFLGQDRSHTECVHLSGGVGSKYLETRIMRLITNCTPPIQIDLTEVKKGLIKN